MKRPFLLLLAAVFLFTGSARAAFYRWVDTDGVVHFTDSRNKIPKKYRSKAKVVRVLQEPATPAAPAAAPPAPPAPAVAHPTPVGDYGGHNESWWREHFSSAKVTIKGFQENLREKQTKMGELRRKRTLYHRAQDREAINTLEESIAQTEMGLARAAKDLDELNQQADKAGVPAEWRQ